MPKDYKRKIIRHSIIFLKVQTSQSVYRKDIYGRCNELCQSDGQPFIANIPTEEVFTAPDRNNVNGYVTNKLPLSYNGNIDGFTLTFKDGEIIDVKAEKGEAVLKDLIETDEGSRRLGEVALVPDDSPISNRRTIFYNTLFDENASCHLAIGSAYGFNVKGGTEMSTEEKLAAGLNDSNVHEDFMIGSSDLTIYGILHDGTKELVLKMEIGQSK